MDHLIQILESPLTSSPWAGEALGKKLVNFMRKSGIEPKPSVHETNMHPLHYFLYI